VKKEGWTKAEVVRRQEFQLVTANKTIIMNIEGKARKADVTRKISHDDRSDSVRAGPQITSIALAANQWGDIANR
jgi:hypothetical protein